MNIIVNGKIFECKGEFVTIAQVVEELQMATAGTAIAVGNAVVAKAQWAQYSLSEGDKVTIIRATQGG